MKTSDLKGKKVTVMGLGLHGGGIGTVEFLAKAGADVLVTDLKSKEELASSLDKLKSFKNVKFIFGQHRQENFINANLIIKSPGVAWTNNYIKIALEKNIPVETDASLFFKLCKNKIIGVTGTKGKTTTSSLIFEILKKAGKSPLKVGIGQISVLNKLEKVKKDTIVIFELSSWRLSSLGRFGLSPKIGVWTNFYPDHLNYYKDLESYKKDKKYIFSSQKSDGWMILNWDQEVLRSFEPEVKSQLIKFSVLNNSRENSLFIRDEKVIWNNGEEEKELFETSKIGLRGEHNRGNVLAACGVAVALGISSEKIREAVSEFSGVAHRLEMVRELNGVKYYNDTAATTPESAISGIRAFSEPLVLIAGGSDKKLDIKDLAFEIKKKTKEVIFIKGLATEKIIAELKKMGERKNYPIVDSMEKAVNLASELAKSGDVVLLSPGAASFGVFQNEFDRGDKFKEAVKQLN